MEQPFYIVMLLTQNTMYLSKNVCKKTTIMRTPTISYLHARTERFPCKRRRGL